MMTDKPTSKNSDNPKEPTSKANTITKSAQKSADSSSSNTSQTKVSVNMSNSTDAIKNSEPKDKIDKADSKSSAEKSIEPPVSDKKAVTKTPSSPKSSSEQAKKTMKSESRSEAPSKISKLAILSFLIGLLAIVGVVLLYFWHVQQQTDVITQLQQVKIDASKSNQLAQEKIMKTLQAQEKSLAMQFTDSANNMKQETQNNIEKLNQMVEKFSQNQPTDWLVHEAEYLVRIAARTLWLEKDTTAAIGLLQDADARITELNDPQILPIRQLIYQDIEALKLIPKLETEQTILSLMALGEQVQSLPLITLTVAREAENADRFTLSEDVSDWRENISKTWLKFLETFVVVHSKVGELEPILPAEQRQHLKENLNLKLQVAQWAVSKGKHNIFIKSLNDAQSWLTQYFDLNDVKNKAFIESIESLKEKVISVNTNHKLVSLKAIRKVLTDKKSVSLPITPIQKEVIETIDETKENVNEKIKDVEKTVQPEVQSNNVESPKTIDNSPKNIQDEVIEKSAEQATKVSEAA
ncbi:uroporphyrinogen-III C-methyltransferase [Pseudocolwellia agarivorans]|uniref:uroporphyrinogen-III C-methyltransferase n=1 Tax=Pseudocolwellia agarivorans TaxID=1911682 RepID=UPI000984645E|nr:uroporphyrinogen-III C-methyltransferase [Pseudocolwellia agarivorans]